MPGKHRVEIASTTNQVSASLKKNVLHEFPIALTQIVSLKRTAPLWIIPHGMVHGIIHHRLKGFRSPPRQGKTIQDGPCPLATVDLQGGRKKFPHGGFRAFQEGGLELNERANQLIRLGTRLRRKHAGLIKRGQHRHHRSNVCRRRSPGFPRSIGCTAFIRTEQQHDGHPPNPPSSPSASITPPRHHHSPLTPVIPASASGSWPVTRDQWLVRHSHTPLLSFPAPSCHPGPSLVIPALLLSFPPPPLVIPAVLSGNPASFPFYHKGGEWSAPRTGHHAWKPYPCPWIPACAGRTRSCAISSRPPAPHSRFRGHDKWWPHTPR